MSGKSNYDINLEELEKRPRLNYFQYYNKNGELLILISKEYGSGWSSQCGGEEQVRLATDTEIVDLFFNHYAKNQYDPKSKLTKKALLPAKDFFQASQFSKEFGYESIHTLQPYFVLRKKIFQIREYDGLEKIYYFNPSQWIQS